MAKKATKAEKDDAPPPEKRPRGRPMFEVRDSQLPLIEKLAGVGCTLEMIAHELDICPTTMDQLIARDPRVKRAVEKGRSSGNKKILETAYAMASNGKNPWMTSFWLRCKLGWKEPRDEIAEDEQKTFNMNYKK